MSGMASIIALNSVIGYVVAWCVSSRCCYCGMGRSSRVSGRSACLGFRGCVMAMAEDTSSISVSLLGPGVISFWLLVFTIW
jgi:hypothetical protein